MTEPLRSRIDQLTNETIPLLRQDPWPKAEHRFTKASLWALDMATETGRPLLIRGEPGIGKSQIARAAAAVLKVPFLSFVVNERTPVVPLRCRCTTGGYSGAASHSQRTFGQWDYRSAAIAAGKQFYSARNPLVGIELEHRQGSSGIVQHILPAVS